MRFPVIFSALSPVIFPALAQAAEQAARQPARPLPPSAEAMADIIDIRPPVTLPAPPWLMWLLLGLAALLLIAGLFFLIRWFVKRKGATPPAPPHEVALSGLSALEAEAELPPKAFYYRLSALFRGYVEARFGFSALEMTSEELLPRLAKIEASEELRRSAADFVRAADPVKYAGVPADRPAMQRDLQTVRGFVEQTVPAPEPGEDDKKREAKERV